MADRDQTQSNYALMRELLEFTAFIEAELPRAARALAERRTGAAGHAHRTTDPGGTL